MKTKNNENKANMRHLSHSEISEWLDGTMSKTVAEHLYSCKECSSKIVLAENIETIASTNLSEILDENFTENLVSRVYPIQAFAYKESFFNRFGVVFLTALAGLGTIIAYLINPNFLYRFIPNVNLTEFYLSRRSLILSGFEQLLDVANSITSGKLIIIIMLITLFLYVVDKTSHSFISKKIGDKL